MTPRERVRMALNHQEPDRVPVDLWGSASRIHTEQYKKIAAYLGLEPRESDLLRPGTTTQYVDFRISDKVESDFRHVNILPPETKLEIPLTSGGSEESCFRALTLLP